LSFNFNCIRHKIRLQLKAYPNLKVQRQFQLRTKNDKGNTSMEGMT